MKKNYLILLIMLMFINISAQVGINTNTPSATLHVQKRVPLTLPDGIIPPRITGDSLRLKDAAYGAAQNGALVYVTSATTTSSTKTGNVSSPGIYMYDATALSGGGAWSKLAQGPGDGAYSTKFTGSSSLLTLNAGLGTTFYSLPLSNANTPVNIPSAQITNNQYIVPSTGVYQINYSFRYEQGLIASVLASAPEMRIMKTTSGINSTLDSRTFGGITLLPNVTILTVTLGVSITLAQGQISHLYNLQQGDVLTFGILRGGLDLSVTSNSAAEISLYKVR